MKNRLRELGKSAIIYGLGDSLKRAIGFLLLPLYTRYLSPADYGDLDVALVVLALSTTVVMQGMRYAFFRHYAESDDPQERSTLLSTSFYYLLFSSIVMYALMLLLAQTLAHLVFTPTSNTTIFIQLVAITGFFEIVVLIPLESFRANLQPGRYIGVSITGFVVQTVINIYLVAVLGIGLIGVLIGYAVGAAIIAIGTILMVRDQLGFHLSRAHLKELLAFGLPLIPVGLSWWLLGVSNRLLLKQLASSHELGLYATGNKFANLLTILLIKPFSTAWGPYYIRIANGPRPKETFSRITSYYLLILCTAGAGIIIFAPPVIKIVAGQQFWDAERVVLPLVWAGIAYGMLSIFDVGISIVKKTQHFAYIVAIGGVTSVTLNWFSIPRLGMMGAAFSLAIAYSVTMLITLAVSQRFYPIPYARGRMGKIGLVFLGISILSAIISIEGLVLSIIVRLALMTIYILALFVIGVITRDEARSLVTVYRKIQRRKGIVAKLRLGLEFFKAS